MLLIVKTEGSAIKSYLVNKNSKKDHKRNKLDQPKYLTLY